MKAHVQYSNDSSIIHHINMTSSNDRSEPSQAHSRLTTPFSIAARSAASSKPANRTRHVRTRRRNHIS